MNHTTIPAPVLALLVPLQLPAEALKYFEDSEIPSTRPNGIKSYTVRYPDPQFGEVLELSSRDIEFAFYLSLRADPAFAFARAQPPKLDLGLPHPRERYYAPDFLVFWNDGRPPTLFETKPSTRFATYCARFPDRYTNSGDKGYEMPLAKEAARKLGFGFRTVHERHFSEKFLRNALFLTSYHQHRELSPAATDEERAAIKAQVVASPGIKITEIRHESLQRCSELVHLMLVEREIFAHLSLELLTEPNRVSLYPSAIQEKALELLYAKNPSCGSIALPYVLEKGVKFSMGKRCFTITEAGARIQFQNHSGQVSTFSHSGFLDLVPAITAFVDAKLTNEERLKRLSDEEFLVLLRRHSLIKPFLPSAPIEIRSAAAPTNRKLQRYLRAFRASELVSPGYGICGLIPRTSERGSREVLLPEAVVAAMRHVVVKHYLQSNPRLTIQDAHHKLRGIMERAGKPCPSYSTFARECRKWDRGVRDRKRWGERIAQLGYVPKAIRSPFGTPHGDRPFMVAHIDHTTSDAALRNPDRAKKLNKPYHSVMVDATTERSLAWATRFDAPKTETLIQILRHCVERNGCLPNTITVDWGPDFRSEWLHKTMADLGVTIYYRMKSNGPAGTPVESRFLSMDGRFTHRLEGSTQIMKRARLVTKALQPLQHALWTLKDFAEGCDRFHDRFNRTPYGKNKQSPNEREETLCKIFGAHPRGVIPKEVYYRALLPFVENTTRIVDRRCRIFVKGHYYSSPELEPAIGKPVEVRQKSATVVFASHVGLPGLVECKAVGHALKHTFSETEAHAIIEERAHPAPEVKAAKAGSWAEGSEEREAIEASLHRARKKSAANANPPSVPDNIVEFDLPAGPLVDLCSMEGDK